MTEPRRDVRHQRRARIAVTGAASPLGLATLTTLLARDPAPRVIGLDTRKPAVAGVTWRAVEVEQPEIVAELAGVDAVIHLAMDRVPSTDMAGRRAVNVRGTELLLAAAGEAAVSRVVMVTSAMVYGAARDNPIPLSEDGPLHAEPGAGLVGDWLGVERAVAHHGADGRPPEVTVVRPASLVGPDTHGMLPGLFEAVRILALRDARCLWQFCHVDDLVAALVAAALGQVSGVVTVGCDGYLERADVERLSGLRSVVVPHSVARVTAERLHRIGAIASPASELEYLMHPWIVGSQQLRATGWTPRWTNERALLDHLERLGDRAGRGLLVLDRKDATRAATGATIALVGSLALARAARAGRRS
ncbi:MAG TPA: NAD-dependent epimerase/dehydratase family protein [Mycobacteriales bacterium]|nr:NAD-dependent epimerase/dehydratase family protein [Mycobacteriales bacterium]